MLCQCRQTSLLSRDLPLLLKWRQSSLMYQLLPLLLKWQQSSLMYQLLPLLLQWQQSRLMYQLLPLLLQWQQSSFLFYSCRYCSCCFSGTTTYARATTTFAGVTITTRGVATTTVGKLIEQSLRQLRSIPLCTGCKIIAIAKYDGDGMFISMQTALTIITRCSLSSIVQSSQHLWSIAQLISSHGDSGRKVQFFLR
jgi:hypothetical protein